MYSVTISNACGIDSESIWVDYISEFPPLDLGKDSTLCPFDSLHIDLQHDLIDQYSWTDGSSEPYKLITESGLYAVTVSNSCGEKSDEITINFLPPLVVNLVSDTFLCPDEHLWVDLMLQMETFV